MTKRLRLSFVRTFLMSFLILMIGTNIESVLASAGTEIFRGFTGHISRQILQDKQAFYVAQTCTTFFYKNIKKPKRPQVEKISYIPRTQTTDDLDCSTRYPKGLDEAREAFSHSQQLLSLSLTFFEFALVGDRDDDQQYAGKELRDVMESFGVTYEDHLPSARYITSLNRVFDTVIDKGEIETLTNSMSILLGKGYRFTPADQAALNRELN